MTDKEIKSLIEDLRGGILLNKEEQNKLADFLESYLSITGFPKGKNYQYKKMIAYPSNPGMSVKFQDAIDGVNFTIGRAIEDCKLALIKKLEGVEDVISKSKIIKYTKKIERYCAKLENKEFDDSQDKWLKGKIKELKEAIKEHILGGER